MGEVRFISDLLMTRKSSKIPHTRTITKTLYIYIYVHIYMCIYIYILFRQRGHRDSDMSDKNIIR